jgi:hypothetical protein
MENVNQNGKRKQCITVVAILAAFLLVAFLVNQMVKLTQPAPVGTASAAARFKDNAEIRAAAADAAKSWGYVDAPKQIVRVPIDEAMKITLQGYQQPAAFRSNILSRVEKAFPPPPVFE